MATIKDLAKGIQTVDELLEESILEPDVDRSDWSSSRARIAFAQTVLERDVLALLDDALFGAEEDLAPRVKRRVASLVGSVAAVFAASGDTEAARALLTKAHTIAGNDPLALEFEAAKDEPSTFAKLTHARWLQGQGDFKGADTALTRARRGTKNKVLLDAIRNVERAPRPLDRAPALFRINGIGVGLYGERDRWPDGSYVATYCFCVLWIPLFPITAYRVRQTDSNAYQFYAKESLGPVARAWRALCLLGALGLGGYSAVTNYLDSPSYKASAAMKEANAAEKAGDRERALERYRFALQEYPQEIDTEAAASSIVRIGAENDVKEPATERSLDAIGRVVNGFYQLPENVRQGQAAGLLGDKLVQYADQIGQGSSEKTQAGLTVLDMAARVTAGRGEQAAILSRRAKLRKSIADAMVEARPLGALRHYVALGDEDSLAAARKIIESLGAAPSLWVEAEAEIQKWTELAGKNGASAEVESIKKRLEAARKKLADDKPIFENGDEKSLKKALTDLPGYQEVALGLAIAMRGRGETKPALEVIAALGPPGRLTTTVQQALADLRAEAGELATADSILTALVDERLPEFQEAQRTYRAAAVKLEAQIEASLRAGNVPRSFEEKVQAAGPAEREELIRGYFYERFRDDPELANLKNEFTRHEVVVSASISLGMLKLRRAATEKGDAQRALLEQAERAFLALQGESAGDPRYHLGLGQVYHRLGRAADGDAEFNGLLAKKDADLTLNVAHAYRELGLEPRARKVAEGVYNDTSLAQDKRHRAAVVRANMATGLEDKEKWLASSDQNSPYVQAQLSNVKGERALLVGNWTIADQAFTDEAAFYEKAAKHNSSAANNVAVAYVARYRATGDIAHLRTSVKWLEASVKAEGDNAIALSNLAEALSHLALLAVLDRWMDTRALRLGLHDTTAVFGVVIDGPFRADIVAALEKDPNQMRMLELSRREQILAPQRTSAYQRELEWFLERADGKALGELRGRLEAMPAFNEKNTADKRAAWLQGELDAEVGALLKQEVSLWHSRIKAMEKNARPPTLAAAWLLLGEALRRQILLEASQETVDEMLRAYRKAQELWPEGFSERYLCSALFGAAFSKARADSTALAKAWDTDRRIYSYSRLAYRAAQGPSRDEVLAALRKQPELAEAVSLRRGKLEGRPSLSDWIIARIAGDAELEKDAEKVFDWDVIKHSTEIEARLLPGVPEEKLDLALMRSRGQSDQL